MSTYLAEKLTDKTQFSAPLPSAHEQGPHGYKKDDEPKCLLKVPVITQPDDYSCGACCTMAVAKYFGVGPNTLGEFKKLLNTTKQKSTDPHKIIEVLESLGLQVVAKQNMTTDDLCYYWKIGAPVIMPIQEYMNEDDDVKDENYGYGHYVVSVGKALGYVFVVDPSIENILAKDGADNAKGFMMIECGELDKDWHDEDLDDEPFEHYGIAVFGKRQE